MHRALAAVLGLATLSASSWAERWEVICPSSTEPYMLSIESNSSYTSSVFSTLDSFGRPTNRIETLVQFSEGAFNLRLIEANNLRAITMQKPTGNLENTSIVTWGKSPYLGSEGPTSEDQCYDANGITKDIIKKIEGSVAFNSLKKAVENQFDNKIESDMFYRLAMVKNLDGNLSFEIKAYWSMEENDCDAIVISDGRFRDISIMKFQDGALFQCELF